MNQEQSIGALAALGVVAIAGLVGKRIFRRKKDITRTEMDLYNEKLTAYHESLEKWHDALEQSVIDAKFWLLVTEEG